MWSRIKLIIVLLLSASSAYAAVPTPAEDDGARAMEFKAYVKSFFMAVDPTKIDGDPDTGHPGEAVADNRVRLMAKWNRGSSLSAEAAYVLEPIAQPPNLQYSAGINWHQQTQYPYRAFDAAQYIYPKPDQKKGSFTLAQNIDRACLTYSPAFGDITIGRQPIALGAARVINPTDVLAPFAFGTLDAEYRLGVDAVRLRIPSGDMGEYEAAFVAGDHFSRHNDAVMLRRKFYVRNTDLTLISMIFRDNLMLGGDLSRSLGDANVYAEAAYVFAKALDDPRPNDNFFRLSAGVDYNFNVAGGLITFVEYHYNGAGAASPSGYSSVPDNPAFGDASDYLLGRHYLAPGVSWQLTALWKLDTSALINICDGSSYWTPALDYSFSDNINVGVGAMIALGKSASSSGSIVVPGSEFGLYSSSYYTTVRIYF